MSTFNLTTESYQESALLCINIDGAAESPPMPPIHYFHFYFN